MSREEIIGEAQQACHTIRGCSNERVLIPGCFGAAFGAGCNCIRQRQSGALENRIKRIETRLDTLWQERSA